jgi:predicted ester cyclase
VSQEEVARRALEVACSRADMGTAKQLYSDEFVDHVNGETFHGHEGIRHSVNLYQRLFRDFEIRVDDQVSEGDRVVSRFTMSGSRAGRRVNVSGIVISRFEDGKIVEDWSVTDTSSLMRQLGVRGTLAAGLTWLRSRP